MHFSTKKSLIILQKYIEQTQILQGILNLGHNYQINVNYSDNSFNTSSYMPRNISPEHKLVHSSNTGQCRKHIYVIAFYTCLDRYHIFRKLWNLSVSIFVLSIWYWSPIWPFLLITRNILYAYQLYTHLIYILPLCHITNVVSFWRAIVSVSSLYTSAR